MVGAVAANSDPGCIMAVDRLQGGFDVADANPADFQDPTFQPTGPSAIWTEGLNARADYTWYEESLKSQSIFFSRLSTRYPDAELFGNISPDSVKQGKADTSYLMAAAASLAKYPDRVRALFTNTEATSGAYNVNFHIRGKPWTVSIDDIMLFEGSRDNARLHFAKRGKDGSLWGALLEKAWAKVKGNYILAGDGYNKNALRALTGAPVDEYFAKDFSATTDSLNAMWNDLQAALAEGSIMIAATAGSGEIVANNQCGISMAHSLSVINTFTMVDKKGNEFKVLLMRDPKGSHGYSWRWSNIDPKWTDDLVSQLQEATGVDFDPRTDTDSPYFVTPFEAFKNNADVGYCFVEVQVARVLHDYSQTWYDQHNAVDAQTYEFTYTPRFARYPLYFTAETWSYNIVPYECTTGFDADISRYGNTPLLTINVEWGNAVDGLQRKELSYADYQNQFIKVSDYAPNDKFTIKVTYNWMGSPRRDFTASVYSVEHGNRISNADGALNELRADIATATDFSDVMQYQTDNEFTFVSDTAKLVRNDRKKPPAASRFFEGYSECSNMNAGQRDEYGDDCPAYVATARCGKYDTDDFKAQAMCCSCGGGCFDKHGSAKDKAGHGCEYYAALPYLCGMYDQDDDSFLANEMCCACGALSAYKEEVEVVVEEPVTEDPTAGVEDFTKFTTMMEKFEKADTKLVVDTDAYKSGSTFNVECISGGVVAFMFTSERDDIYVREVMNGAIDYTGDYDLVVRGKTADTEEWDGLYYWWVSYEVFGLQGSADIKFKWWNAELQFDYKMTVNIDGSALMADLVAEEQTAEEQTEEDNTVTEPVAPVEEAIALTDLTTYDEVVANMENADHPLSDMQFFDVENFDPEEIITLNVEAGDKIGILYYSAAAMDSTSLFSAGKIMHAFASPKKSKTTDLLVADGFHFIYNVYQVKRDITPGVIGQVRHSFTWNTADGKTHERMFKITFRAGPAADEFETPFMIYHANWAQSDLSPMPFYRWYATMDNGDTVCRFAIGNRLSTREDGTGKCVYSDSQIILKFAYNETQSREFTRVTSFKMDEAVEPKAIMKWREVDSATRTERDFFIWKKMDLADMQTENSITATAATAVADLDEEEKEQIAAPTITTNDVLAEYKTSLQQIESFNVDSLAYGSVVTVYVTPGTKVGFELKSAYQAKYPPSFIPREDNNTLAALEYVTQDANFAAQLQSADKKTFSWFNMFDVDQSAADTTTEGLMNATIEVYRDPREPPQLNILLFLGEEPKADLGFDEEGEKAISSLEQFQELYYSSNVKVGIDISDPAWDVVSEVQVIVTPGQNLTVAYISEEDVVPTWEFL